MSEARRECVESKTVHDQVSPGPLQYSFHSSPTFDSSTFCLRQAPFLSCFSPPHSFPPPYITLPSPLILLSLLPIIDSSPFCPSKLPFPPASYPPPPWPFLPPSSLVQVDFAPCLFLTPCQPCIRQPCSRFVFFSFCFSSIYLFSASVFLFFHPRNLI